MRFDTRPFSTDTMSVLQITVLFLDRSLRLIRFRRLGLWIVRFLLRGAGGRRRGGRHGRHCRSSTNAGRGLRSFGNLGAKLFEFLRFPQWVHVGIGVKQIQIVQSLLDRFFQ